MLKKSSTISLVILVLLCLTSTSGLGEQVDYTCGFNTSVGELLAQTQLSTYSNWIKRLSGETPVQINHGWQRIQSRHTCAMFLSQSQRARALEYLTQQVRFWYPNSQVTLQPFQINACGASFTAYNLILEIPGAGSPEEVVILSAHFDDTSNSSWNLPDTYAPGADDNATGVAALLEAARLLRHYRFNRTLRLIWFSGEEQGLVGSKAYVNQGDLNLNQIIGVINMDMFGYDGDNDRCLELHVGTLPASDQVGQCFTKSIDNYDLNLTYDYLTANAIPRSDHAEFWYKGIGAIEVLENAHISNLPNGCVEKVINKPDVNPNYHKITDTLANIHPEYAYDIARAGMAAAAGLAGPLGACPSSTTPNITQADVSIGKIELGWSAVPETVGYRVFRSREACSGEIEQIADVNGLTWEDHRVADGRIYHYWVEAFSNSACFSQPGACTTVEAEALTTFLPAVFK